MDGADQVDDRTFRVNFTFDGLAKLRDRVNDKLKEFMGDYTDDTLVFSWGRGLFEDCALASLIVLKSYLPRIMIEVYLLVPGLVAIYREEISAFNSENGLIGNWNRK
ncbi:RNA binding (RRM/RBD/RNP motifs) family protein [Actinidia rufa]|uniref:RNA binding (RRM/RBD/RNP motifs) family protein n=1 Tax=Actinidia rufa TaxID=165716 RepID=A0A7J0FP06_9ERIC|nr:RNA binding (RRM/RBD/RNP motifs) family protein [Actinidia rufa]GFZ00462.1 RNA binding (RRM/RBD/RNP motifs) family protein [Actinidia rufa]